MTALEKAARGLRTFASDRVPVLGEDPAAPGFWWLAGQGGAGIKTAPAMAELLRAAMNHQPFPEEDALSPARFRI